MEVRFYEIGEIEDSLLTFAVIVARYMDKWVWVKNKMRKAWEVPGGRRENNETILDTARRELYEETGATEFDLIPVCIYSVKKEIKTFGMLYFAEITELDTLPNTEIEAINFFENIPEELSFPLIQPKLLYQVQKYLEM